VAWDILAFLFLSFVTALGLENIGVTVTMSEFYTKAGPQGSDGIALVRPSLVSRCSIIIRWRR
jgi:hypothetical protein